MKRLFLVSLLMLILLVFAVGTVNAISEQDKIDILKESANYPEFEDSLEVYLQTHPIYAEDVVNFNNYLATQVSLTQSEADDWWKVNGWYVETDTRWIFCWSAWYMKFMEKFNGTSWVIYLNHPSKFIYDKYA